MTRLDDSGETCDDCALRGQEAQAVGICPACALHYCKACAESGWCPENHEQGHGDLVALDAGGQQRTTTTVGQG